MNAEMLLALRDPAGVPSHPLVFLLLGVLTFALHIAAVQVMLGAGTLVLSGAFRADVRWRRLAAAMLATSKIAVSVAIVIGVAPLLFVQVVYDPFWYTSNVLSAWWVIGFIVILIAGYSAMYGFYWLNEDLRARPARGGWLMVASLALLLLVGWIMHVLSYQMLWPEQWREWYAPGGTVDASGRTLHAYSVARFAFFIALAAPVTGAWLVAVRRYLIGAQEADAGYLALLQRLSQQLLLGGGAVAVVAGAAWMAMLPEKMAWFLGSAPMVLAAAMLVLTVLLPSALGRRLDQGGWGYAVFGVGAVALIVVAAAREWLRYVTLLGAHGYDAMTYRVNFDAYSTVTFFATFAIVGGVVLGWLLTVAWQAGQTRGTYTPSPAVARLGRWSVALIALWIVHYFAIGAWVMVR
ncbi:hypothetical protein [Rubrivivax albus]|uniref:Uncharacterized protein n=1 Tax=Rubrivivax albus TaxID=2499835 RepID=A0A3S2U9H1_9BURK|nr:hypothetical protein [Rubrivivax albus]RVT52259.1 hypothetical protein ENE75_07320 [Rubrivivax albus]